MSKQDGFREKANEVLAQLDSEDLLCPQDDCPKCGSNVTILAAALRAAHNSALDSVLAAIAREQNYREYRSDKVGDQDGSAIGACKEIAGYVKALKSPEGGGV